MKLASLSFQGEKKNPDHSTASLIPLGQLIPASFFHRSIKKDITPVISHPLPEKETTEETEGVHHPKEPLTAKSIPISDSDNEDVTLVDTSTLVTEPARKIHIKDHPKRVSGLSISSIKAKKKHELNKIEVTYDDDSLPDDVVTEAELHKHWHAYVNKVDEEGKKILASNLSSDTPKLMDGSTIVIELPNDTMKKEVERDQLGLMTYLKKALNNYHLSLSISVNEETIKKYAFTPQEKYDKLREKNPAIDLLRKTFDLDL
jgi:DNA polymerase-3 subunit gamma/tau